MSSIKIKENIYWVGAIDHDIRNFHGYLTPMGSTYNAYLVIDEKVTLIDTVKEPFTSELIANISEIIDPSNIDIIISNHVEPDHSGSLTWLRKLCPKAKIVTSPNGEKGLRAYYKSALENSEIHTVKTGDTLCTGRYNFTFMLMPMVHWPDSMATFLPEEKVLFPNDAFGQHIASYERFDNEIDLNILLERANDYYANIVLPFGVQVKKVLDDISKFEIDTICPSHGVILRNNITQMIEKYSDWSQNKTNPKKAVIVYETMWGTTKEMAENLARELCSKGYKTTLFNLKNSHISTVMAGILEAEYIAVGSPTLNRNMMPSVAAFLSYMKGLAPKNRKGIAFGSYGWSGESIGQVEEVLKLCGFELDLCEKTLWKV